MKWDMIGLGEVRRKQKSFPTLQSGHLLYHSEANNGQAGVGFLVNKKWKNNVTRVTTGNSRVAKLVLRITDRYQLKIVQVYAPTTSHSDEETYNYYNTIGKVMGDFNATIGGQTNTAERATGCFGLGQRNERGDTLVEWATSKNVKIMNTLYEKAFHSVQPQEILTSLQEQGIEVYTEILKDKYNGQLSDSSSAQRVSEKSGSREE